MKNWLYVFRAEMNRIGYELQTVIDNLHNIGSILPKYQPINLVAYLYLLAMRKIASRLFSTSCSVVAQELTLMRIAVLPCHSVPPIQQVPSSWMAAITRRVASGLPNDTRYR